MPFLAQNRLDDLGAVRFAEALVFEERLSIIVSAGDDGLSRRLDAGNEALGAGVCEVLQGRGDLVSKAIAGVFAVPNDDFLKAFDAPQISILANATVVETGNAERL